ncbi:hypothetical protein AFFFEF_00818 [Methylorubrum extorquens]
MRRSPRSRCARGVANGGVEKAERALVAIRHEQALRDLERLPLGDHGLNVGSHAGAVVRGDDPVAIGSEHLRAHTGQAEDLGRRRPLPADIERGIGPGLQHLEQGALATALHAQRRRHLLAIRHIQYDAGRRARAAFGRVIDGALKVQDPQGPVGAQHTDRVRAEQTIASDVIRSLEPGLILRVYELDQPFIARCDLADLEPEQAEEAGRPNLVPRCKRPAPATGEAETFQKPEEVGRGEAEIRCVHRWVDAGRLRDTEGPERFLLTSHRGTGLICENRPLSRPTD